MTECKGLLSRCGARCGIWFITTQRRRYNRPSAEMKRRVFNFAAGTPDLGDASRFPSTVREKLLQAGWGPGRSVLAELTLPRDRVLFDAAARVLGEFGGLKFVEQHGSADLDPHLADEVATEVTQFEHVTGKRFYPLGKIDGGDVLYLLVDEIGVIWTLSGALEPLASSFEQALRYLVKVCAYKPSEFRADLESIGMYGTSWRLP